MDMEAYFEPGDTIFFTRSVVSENLGTVIARDRTVCERLEDLQAYSPNLIAWKGQEDMPGAKVILTRSHNLRGLTKQ